MRPRRRALLPRDETRISPRRSARPWTSVQLNHEGRFSNHVYFAALLEPAVWGAELAVALAGGLTRGRIYVVEPTGPFEDDPNVTNKRFPGNVTKSYRTKHPMRVVEEVETWKGHAPDVIQGMVDTLAGLREEGLDLVED